MIVAQAHGLMEKFRKRNLNICQLIYNQNFKLFKLRAFSTSIAGTLIDEGKNQNQNGKKFLNSYFSSYTIKISNISPIILTNFVK